MTAPNFYIWTLNVGKRSACSYYRIEVPMMQLSQLNYAQLYVDNGETNSDNSRRAMLHADISHFYAISGEQFLHQFQVFKRMKPALRQGHEIYPPTIIYDIDDNTDFVHPFNTTFALFGVRGYPDARLLKPGEGLEIIDSKGRPVIYGDGHQAGWVDGETNYNGTTFDIARNLHQMKVRHQIIREAHGVTVTSPTLARYMREVIGVQNVYVFPNTIVPEHFEKIRAVRTDKSIRILWQGGQSHWPDWYPLRDALKTISQKYPNVKFILFGERFKWVHEHIPDHMIEYHAWEDYSAYKLKRGLLNADINLCPLVNNVFNACKSAIKWYEGSIWETPEATLAAKCATYDEIIDGKTGLIYETPEQFVEKLSLLIEDAELRKRLGEGARDWVLANRTPQATIPGLYDFYTETRARHRRDLGKPIIQKPTLEEIKKVGMPLR